jgi:hypothetical protein
VKLTRVASATGLLLLLLLLSLLLERIHFEESRGCVEGFLKSSSQSNEAKV